MNNTTKKSIQKIGNRTSKMSEAKQIIVTLRSTGASEKKVQAKVRQFWKNVERDDKAGLNVKTTVMRNY